MASAARILVVDDEAHARNALSELLRDEGYDVDTAEDGVAARERLAEFQPDLVLSDVEMPRMSGIELAAAMRAAPNAPALVLMSSRHLAGGSVVVQKPIAVGELLTVIAQALADHYRRT